MRKIILLAGFNNWGKTTLINGLFGKTRFIKHKLHQLSSRMYCVIPQSNDDLGELGYIKEYQNKIDILSNNAIQPKHIISAFCPTKENNNDSIRIINSVYKNDEVYVLAIINKWCGHAKLVENELVNYYSSLKNVKIIPIKKKGNAQLAEVNSILATIL